MCLAIIREDRFVGIESAPGSVGQWTTSEIALPSDPGQLIVNAVVDGSLLVEVLDPTTLLPIGEFSAANGVAITPGDYIDAVARWNGINDLNDLAGQTVSLRFVMDDATVYSFHFEPTPEPSALGLLGAGAVALIGYHGWKWRGAIGVQRTAP